MFLALSVYDTQEIKSSFRQHNVDNMTKKRRKRREKLTNDVWKTANVNDTYTYINTHHATMLVKTEDSRIRKERKKSNANI